ncbi:MAG: hypothetical protein DCF21_12915, partial [Leptolyngbya sp.]
PGVGKSTFLRKVGLEALRTLGRRDFAGKDPGNLLVPQGIFYQHPCIPVMLELRQFDKPNGSIKAVIAAELETCGFPHPEELTELFLKNGKLLVLLDGLDEVPASTLDHTLKEIRSLVDRYSDNRYIASCRVAAYTFGGFTRFKDVAMAAFEDEQIEQFIQNWFQKERDAETNTADRCWELLNSPDYQAAKELAQTPLLLTLLCVVYDEFQDFPKKRHALYGEALDVLLRKWASEKRIQRNPIYQELSAELELDMLAEIAYTSFVDDQLFFSKERPINQIREFLVDNLNAPSHLDAETVLKEIEIQQGILVERARGAYSFSHLTFQEYLTAKCIVDNNKVDQLVRDHVTDQHWREVFMLVAGLVPGKRGADDLLLAMEQQARTYLDSYKLKNLLAWATLTTENSPRVANATVKRFAAIFLAFDYTCARARALDRARALIRTLVRDLDLDLDLIIDVDLGRITDADLDRIIDSIVDPTFTRGQRCFPILVTLSPTVFIAHYSQGHTRIRTLALALARANLYQAIGIFPVSSTAKIFADLNNVENQIRQNYFHYYSKYNKYELRYSQDISQEKHKELQLEIVEAFEKNLNLKADSLPFSVREFKQMANYLYILELMVRCKEAAVRVSPHVWAGIESRMVTVPTE